MTEIDVEIRIPEPEEVRNLVIQEEFVWLRENGTERKVRLHDYAQMYGIPHLYEHIASLNELCKHIIFFQIRQIEEFKIKEKLK